MRVIQPKMISYLEWKLENNGLYLDAVKRKDARLISILAMQSCVGKREETGNNDGLFIELVQQTVDGIDSREAYCMAGVQTGVAFAEYKTGILSKLPPGEHCMTVWRAGKLIRVVGQPQAGDVIIWNHAGGDSGHTGMAYEVLPSLFKAVEFNTTSGKVGSSIVREGGGIYNTERSYKQIGDMVPQGFLRPF